MRYMKMVIRKKMKIIIKKMKMQMLKKVKKLIDFIYIIEDIIKV